MGTNPWQMPGAALLLPSSSPYCRAGRAKAGTLGMTGDQLGLWKIMTRIITLYIYISIHLYIHIYIYILYIYMEVLICFNQL